MNKSQATKKFDTLFRQAEKVLNSNPCEGRCVEGVVTCIGCSSKSSHSNNMYAEPNILCCGNCRFHSRDKGCTAEQPLTCKLWLCEHAKERHPEAASLLEEIQNRAMELDLYYPRGDKQAHLEDFSLRNRIKNWFA